MGQNTTATPKVAADREGQEAGQEIRTAWHCYVRPLLQRFSQRLDLRLVRTLRDGVEAAIRLRLRPQGLWLTE